MVIPGKNFQIRQLRVSKYLVRMISLQHTVNAINHNTLKSQFVDACCGLLAVNQLRVSENFGKNAEMCEDLFLMLCDLEFKFIARDHAGK